MSSDETGRSTSRSSDDDVSGQRHGWAVLSEDGTVYCIGRWHNGRKRHDGALWLALWEWWQLRRHEPAARVVRR